MPFMKGMQKQKWRRPIGQQPGTKSIPAGKPLMHKSSTSYRVPPFGLDEISIVRASEGRLVQDSCLRCPGGRKQKVRALGAPL